MAARRKTTKDDDLHGFVEEFAMLLIDGGMPRMPARAFAAVLASPDGRMTARELAEFLDVSPAAISGAMRYLTATDLLQRRRERGARVDHYQLDGDTWYRVFADREALMQQWETALTRGVAIVGPRTDAGRRLAETRDFFAFMAAELPAMMQRWQRHQRRKSAT